MVGRTVREKPKDAGIYPLGGLDDAQALMQRLVGEGHSPILVTSGENPAKRFIVVSQHGSLDLYKSLSRQMKDARLPEPAPSPAGLPEAFDFFVSRSPDGTPEQIQLVTNGKARQQVAQLAGIFKKIESIDGVDADDQLLRLRVELLDQGIALGMDAADAHATHVLYQNGDISFREGERKPPFWVSHRGSKAKILVDDSSELYPLLAKTLSLPEPTPTPTSTPLGRGSFLLSDAEGHTTTITPTITQRNQIERVFKIIAGTQPGSPG